LETGTFKRSEFCVFAYVEKQLKSRVSAPTIPINNTCGVPEARAAAITSLRKRQECVGIGESVYTTMGRTTIKITLAGFLVYFFDTLGLESWLVRT